MKKQQLINDSNLLKSNHEKQLEKDIKLKNSVKVFTINPQNNSSYIYHGDEFKDIKESFLLEIQKMKKILSVETKKDFVKKEKTITIKSDLE